MRRDDRDSEERRRTRGLMALALVLGLALVASYIVDRLEKESAVEDCLLAQRNNCDALVNDN